MWLKRLLLILLIIINPLDLATHCWRNLHSNTTPFDPFMTKVNINNVSFMCQRLRLWVQLTKWRYLEKWFSVNVRLKWYKYIISLQIYLIILNTNILVKMYPRYINFDMYTVHDALGMYLKVVLLTWIIRRYFSLEHLHYHRAEIWPCECYYGPISPTTD